MPQPRVWTPARAVAAILAVLVIAGCATGTRQDPTDDTTVQSIADLPTAPADPPDDISDWGLSLAEVTAVRPGDSDSTVLIETEVYVAPPCAGHPEASNIQWEYGDFYATIAVPTDPAPQESGRDCPAGSSTGELLLDLGQPLGDAALILNQDPWERDPAGGYRPCDEYLGCGDPPEDTCQGYTGRFLAFLDVPRHSRLGVEDCDGTWMTFHVDAAASFCGPQDGESTCDVPSQLKYAVLWFDASVPAWVEKDWVTPERGCDQVLADLPDFPAAMCEALTFD